MREPAMNPSLKILSLALLLATAACNRNEPATNADVQPLPAESAPVPMQVKMYPQHEMVDVVVIDGRARGIVTRNLVTGALEAQAADAVVANAKQLSGAVAGFYGKAGGDRMMELLGGHWGAVKALTDARAKNDNAAADKAMNDATTNAGDIAKFLAGANPNLPEDTVRGLMLAHVAHHGQQIQQIMAGDMAGEATSWAAMQQHMDMIADALASAIARQFPDKAA